MRGILLAWLLLLQPALAQAILKIDWTPVDDRSWKGRLVLSAPAPEGGAKIIFEPTFHIHLPTQVTVPAGQTTVEFPVLLVDNTFIEGFTGISEAGFDSSDAVTAFYNGQLWKGPGPDRRRFQ